MWSAETGFGSRPDHKRSRPPFSTVLDVLSAVSARAGDRSVRVSWYARFTRVRSNNLSTQLRRTRTSSLVSPPVPTTVADHEQTADSEQIRLATIALHTEQEKTRNLQETESFNDWGERGYDDSVPGVDTKTATSEDRTARSSIWSASLP